jgi:hypothetical protein
MSRSDRYGPLLFSRLDPTIPSRTGIQLTVRFHHATPATRRGRTSPDAYIAGMCATAGGAVPGAPLAWPYCAGSLWPLDANAGPWQQAAARAKTYTVWIGQEIEELRLSLSLGEQCQFRLLSIRLLLKPEE